MTTVLFDGNFMFARMHGVKELQNLRTSKGDHTGGTFGIIRSLRRVIRSFPVNRIVFVWDSGISSRRRALDPIYKAHRGKTSDPNYKRTPEDEQFLTDFITNKTHTSYLLSKLGVKVLAVKGKEADDVLAYVSSVKQLSGESCIVVSEDNDMLQLVNERVHVYKPVKQEYITQANFAAKVGWRYDQFMLARSLLGDGGPGYGDGISGIPGVGPAAVAEVLEYASTIEEAKLYCECSNQKKLNKISDNIDRVYLNEKLLDLYLEEFTEEQKSDIARIIHSPAHIDLRKIMECLTKLEMLSLLPDLTSWVIPFQRLC